MAFDDAGPIRAMQEVDLEAVLAIATAAQLTPWRRRPFLAFLVNAH